MSGQVRLFGHPVAHSISPAIHNAGFAALGIDAVYEAMDVPPAELVAAVQRLRDEQWLGANLTIPHKLAVLDLVEQRTEETRLIGAANTLYWDDDQLVADNTDARGLEQALRALPELPARGQAVILGSGGAARAAAVALARIGLSVAVVARREVPAESVAQTAAALGVEAVGLPLEHARAVVSDAVVVLNATPLGLHGDAPPDVFMDLHDGQVAVDLVYGPTDTAFIAAANARGLATMDGLAMLVNQAALAFSRWTGQAAPLAAMHEAAKQALAAR